MVQSILENGKMVQCMVTEPSGGQMGYDILDNIFKINWMAMEF